jgi:hypothetical protein
MVPKIFLLSKYLMGVDRKMEKNYYNFISVPEGMAENQGHKMGPWKETKVVSDEIDVIKESECQKCGLKMCVEQSFRAPLLASGYALSFPCINNEDQKREQKIEIKILELEDLREKYLPQRDEAQEQLNFYDGQILLINKKLSALKKPVKPT